jgi:hypothetical protein
MRENKKRKAEGLLVDTDALDTDSSSIGMLTTSPTSVASSDNGFELGRVGEMAALPDTPIPTVTTEYIHGSPIKRKCSRNAAEDLPGYYNRISKFTAPEQSDFDKSKIIFVGSNHRNTAFYSLVSSLLKGGKKIRAIFMEELNADEITYSHEQAILDRHFVANPNELEDLELAHSCDSLLQDDMVDHIIKESAQYLDKLAPTKKFLKDFFTELSTNNVKLGGVDHSRYRAMPTYGYNYHRQSQMNYFATNVIASYIKKDPLFITDDSIILVSIGNSHNINGYKDIPLADGSMVKISGILKALSMEFAPSELLPMTSVSLITNVNTADTYGSVILDKKIIQKGTIEDKDMDELLSSRYTAISRNNSEACSQAVTLAGRINLASSAGIAGSSSSSSNIAR